MKIHNSWVWQTTQTCSPLPHCLNAFSILFRLFCFFPLFLFSFSFASATMILISEVASTSTWNSMDYGRLSKVRRCLSNSFSMRKRQESTKIYIWCQSSTLKFRADAKYRSSMKSTQTCSLFFLDSTLDILYFHLQINSTRENTEHHTTSSLVSSSILDFLLVQHQSDTSATNATTALTCIVNNIYIFLLCFFTNWTLRFTLKFHFLPLTNIHFFSRRKQRTE